MNNFYESFNNARNNQPNSKMLLIFNQKRDYIKDGEHISFVEGPDDVKFYKYVKSNTSLQNIDRCNYIYANNNEKEVRGKKGVLMMYNYINNNFSKYLDKCIFIVDHDYNGLNGYNI